MNRKQKQERLVVNDTDSQEQECARFGGELRKKTRSRGSQDEAPHISVREELDRIVEPRQHDQSQLQVEDLA